MIRTFKTPYGIDFSVEYYSGLKNFDNDIIYLYDKYEKLTMTNFFRLSINPDADIDNLRELFRVNKTNSNITFAFRVYNMSGATIYYSYFQSDLFKRLNYNDDLTDEEVLALTAELRTAGAMNEGKNGFIRGNEYNTDLQISNLVLPAGNSTSINAGVIKSFVVNEFPTYDETKTKLENIQCYSTFGPDNEKYKDSKFIDIIQIGNIPNLIASDKGEDHLLSVYCKVCKKGDTSYGTWINCLTSSVNAVNIGQKTNEGDYLPVNISISSIVNDLEAGDKVKLGLFAHTVNEIKLVSDNELVSSADWDSGEFELVTLDSIEPAIINNIPNNSTYPDKVYLGTEIEETVISPIVTATDTQIAFYNSIKVQFTDNDGQTWYNFNMTKIQLEGPQYKCEVDENGNLKLDENGEPIKILDASGNPIILVPAVYSYVYDTDREYFGIGTYNLQSRIILNDDIDNAIYGEKITFEIYENIIPEPVILYWTLTDDTKKPLKGIDLHVNEPVFISYEPNDKFTNVSLFTKKDGGEYYFINDGYRFFEGGHYTVKAEGVTATGESSILECPFVLSTDLPEVIEIIGVTNYEVAERYTIKIKRDSNSSYDISYTNVDTGVSTVPTLVLVYDEYGVAWYSFDITVKGIYNLDIIATHNDSLLTRSLTISEFEVYIGSRADHFVTFNPNNPPLHSTLLSLVPTSTKYNLYYWLKEKPNNSVGTRYLSPLLLTENMTVYGEEIYGSTKNLDDNIFNGIKSDNVPELPEVKGVYDGEVSYNSKTVSFTNIASKPNQSEYIILLDGKQLENPFEKNKVFEVNTEGYHYILILGWDTIRPTDFCYSEIEFSIEVENEYTLREPGIIIGTENEKGEVDFTVNFSSLHPDVTHTIEIKYNDGTSESHSYPYNQGIVTLTVSKNCVITATSTFSSGNKYSKSSNAMVNSIFDTKPDISDLKVFGINKMTLNTVSFGKVTMNIGPCAWINFPHGTNTDYNVYINGMPYLNYSDYEDESDETYGKDAHFAPIIENETEELRKYSLEVIAKNRFEPNKTSYYYNEFIIDSLGHPYPSLENIYPNIMNRLALPQEIREKHEENIEAIDVLLNNRVIDITSYVITKDDEYLLTMTYTYYDGTKRTSCFQFSINSNVIDKLKPLRLIIKAKDFQDIPNYEDFIKKGFESEAHDGELIIDRQTGHLYFGSKGELEKIELIPITKDMELMVNEIEASLLLADKSLNKLHYYHELAKEMMDFYVGNLDSFLGELRKNKENLELITIELDLLKENINELKNDINSFKYNSLNQTDYVSEEIINRTNSLQSNMTELLAKFMNITTKVLPELFSRGAEVKENSYYLQNEIKKCVTVDNFNTWKANEDAKYTRLAKACYNFWGW